MGKEKTLLEWEIDQLSLSKVILRRRSILLLPFIILLSFIITATHSLYLTIVNFSLMIATLVITLFLLKIMTKGKFIKTRLTKKGVYQQLMYNKLEKLIYGGNTIFVGWDEIKKYKAIPKLFTISLGYKPVIFTRQPNPEFLVMQKNSFDQALKIFHRHLPDKEKI